MTATDRATERPSAQANDRSGAQERPTGATAGAPKPTARTTANGATEDAGERRPNRTTASAGAPERRSERPLLTTERATARPIPSARPPTARTGAPSSMDYGNPAKSGTPSTMLLHKSHTPSTPSLCCKIHTPSPLFVLVLETPSHYHHYGGTK